MTVGEVLQQLGWVATRQRLLACGITRKQIDDALAVGEIARLQPGVYGPPDGFADVAAAVRLGGALSHVSAAQWWGLEMLHKPTSTHVTVPLSLKKVAPPGVTVHRADVPLTSVHQMGVTTALQTVIDCLRTMPTIDAVAIADSAVRLRVATQREIERAVAELRGKGAPAAKRSAGMLGLSESVLESACRVALLEAGIARPHEQLEVMTVDGLKRVDFAWPEQRVVLEAEGFATHGLRWGLVQDCRRTNGLQLAGWLVLRVAWEHVMGEPDYVASIVRHALGGEPHLPTLGRLVA